VPDQDAVGDMAGGSLPGGAADVESYIWKTQRITLTREASARLDAAALKIIPDRGSPTDPDRVRWMRDHVFEVRLNGKLLYGGFFTSPWSGRTCPFPVIHPEWVEGQFVFYLLPVNMFPGELGELEETVGASTFWMRLAHRLAPRPAAPYPGRGPDHRSHDPLHALPFDLHRGLRHRGRCRHLALTRRRPARAHGLAGTPCQLHA
jgi:hypothetical protein